MSSKRRKEKSYSIHGMQSILSAFISRHQFAIKPYDFYGTNWASTGCFFRYLEQFGYVKKKKTQWKIRRYKSTSLFQITVGYNQWCPRLHHKKRTSNSLKKKRRKRWDGRESGLFQKKKKRGMEEKVVDFKKRRGGRETKEKDIMKRRQEGEEEEKKMGTEERERRRSR